MKWYRLLGGQAALFELVLLLKVQIPAKVEGEQVKVMLDESLLPLVKEVVE